MPALQQFVGALLLSTAVAASASDAANAHDAVATRADQQVSIVYRAQFSDAEKQLLQRWLSRASAALRSVYGELPRDGFEVILERSASRNSPVPWGHIERGRPTRVVMVVNPELGARRLLADWTVFHELSHLLLPYRGYGDLWFSEGLATYYQNIIQARAGLFDEEQMWRRLSAGFERGQQQTAYQHLTLHQLSDRMRETRQYMRIHWSGVLYWLTADVQLRKDGSGSLDEALHALKDCCQQRALSARAIAAKLDELTGRDVFLPLFEAYRNSHRIPDYSGLLNRLGVVSEPSAGVTLSDTASLADLRQGIFRN